MKLWKNYHIIDSIRDRGYGSCVVGKRFRIHEDLNLH